MALKVRLEKPKLKISWPKLTWSSWLVRGVIGTVLLVGIIGRSFNVGTDLGPYVSRALPEVLDLIVEYVRQRGGTVEKRKAPLPIKSWWNSVAPA